MIKQWTLRNFKSVQNETELEIAPLTIFAGANSSGKSTFLQSILIVAQTLAHKVNSRSVVLNGTLARLGQFDDLKSIDSGENQIAIGWTCDPLPHLQNSRRTGFIGMPFYFDSMRQPLSSISCRIAFDTKDSETEREIAQIQPLLFSSELSVLTRNSDTKHSRFFMTIRREKKRYISKQKWTDGANSENMRRSLQYDVELNEESLTEIRDEFISAEVVGCLLRHFLLERIVLGVDKVVEDAQVIINVLTGDKPRYSGYYREYEEITVPASVVEFILELIHKSLGAKISKKLQHKLNSFESQNMSLENLSDALRSDRRSRMEIRRKLSDDNEFKNLVNHAIQTEREEEPALTNFRVPRPISYACRYIDQFFTSVRYLGPLRDDPKSLYPLSPTADPSDVGLKGEHTAAVLELHKNRRIQYIPSSSFTKSEINTSSEECPLQTAVVDWLRYLEVAERVESQDKGKLGHELTVSIDGSKQSHDLTHVGVGVSQVLPILVVCLLAEPDTTLIFEQPELHLHPKVQTRLADFFLSMTQLGKQCIIETHSEYLINRIRFRTAAAVKSNPWLEAVKMYFVKKEGQVSTFREVNINEYGAILDWPEDFFDQSQREAEAILRAAVNKRKNQRER